RPHAARRRAGEGHCDCRGRHAGRRLRGGRESDRRRFRLHAAQPADPLRMTVQSASPLAAPGKGRAARGWLKRLLLLRESPIGLGGAFVVLFWLVVATLAPVLSPYDPNVNDYDLSAPPPDGGPPAPADQGAPAPADQSTAAPADQGTAAPADNGSSSS